MGKVVETKKKKKGRPSLLDLQKRTLREQQQLQQQQQQQQQKRKSNNSAPHSNPNYRSAPTQTPLRRSTRRNPSLDPEDDDQDEAEEDDDVLAGKRREKKLKLVLKLPPNQKASANSASLNSGGGESNAEDDSAASDDDVKGEINAIGDGSAVGRPKKGEKSISATNPSIILQGGTKFDSGPSTPLPDKKLLLFILDRIQKKDTYGVFSEPVDPKELPDYHEVIEHPMDFATVKKKLTGGAYASLEHFESDVFLICSNAMQYNAPDTIYFRQARSIQELAKKNFENLRQDSDDNEPGPKRRGRPPTKNLKKPLGRPSLERAGSEFSDATLATGAENATNYDLRKGSDKSGFADSSGRFHGSRNNDVNTSWLADNKFERNDDLTGSTLRGNSKLGRKQFVFDENRRNTYKQSHPSAGGRESSVLTTFDGERKQLTAVGLHSDYGYARSLARFAANIGPVAWKVASKKIERSLPAGVMFGPGWVGENDVAPHRPLLSASSSLGQQPSSSQPFPIHANSASATSCSVESSGGKLPDKPLAQNSSDKNVPSIPSALGGRLNSPIPLSAATSSTPLIANRSPEPLTGKAETIEGSNSRTGPTGFNMLNSNLGVIRPRPPFQIHQNPAMQPGINGFNGTYGLNLPAQMGKLIGATRPGGYNFQSSQVPDTVSRTNTNFIHPATSNSLNSEETKFSENPGTINSSAPFPNSVNEALATRTTVLHPRPSWQGLSQQQKPDSGLSPQQKPDSVPPDLNVRFQSPGSPNSSRADSTQPDLALQL